MSSETMMIGEDRAKEIQYRLPPPEEAPPVDPVGVMLNGRDADLLKDDYQKYLYTPDLDNLSNQLVIWMKINGEYRIVVVQHSGNNGVPVGWDCGTVVSEVPKTREDMDQVLDALLDRTYSATLEGLEESIDRLIAPDFVSSWQSNEQPQLASQTHPVPA